jgi:hypothetical protein
MTDPAWLRSAVAIRARCGLLYDAGLGGKLDWIDVAPERIDAVAAYVEAETRRNYPDLKIPYHSRWRHFGAIDPRPILGFARGVPARMGWSRAAGPSEGNAAARSQAAPPLTWRAARATLSPPGGEGLEFARTAADLAVVSVLLDAGAGAAWRYHDAATGQTLGRSEGLAVASLRMFEAGGLHALEALTVAQLAEGFQVRADNPLVGLEARVALLNRLGRAMRERPDVFGTPARFGNLIDTMMAPEVPLPKVLSTLLDALAPIWPSGLVVGGVNLGDVAEHRLAGLVPFHKLTQWLTYSLIEPFEWAGAAVTELDGLTGLPEYRNGGLFVDLGVLTPRRLPDAPLEPRHPLVVEWRACTIILLDLLAERLRSRLGLDAAALPLARLLQGGTWTAGRRVAAERRADGSPPIAVLTDGTTF